MKKLILLLIIAVGCSTPETDLITGKWNFQYSMSQDHEITLDYTDNECFNGSNLKFEKDNKFTATFPQGVLGAICPPLKETPGTWDYEGKKYELSFEDGSTAFVETIDSKTIKMYVPPNSSYSILIKK